MPLGSSGPFAWQRAMAVLWERPVCDACLASHAGIAAGRVSKVLRRWVERHEVERTRERCPGCNAIRLVNRGVGRLFGGAGEVRQVTVLGALVQGMIGRPTS